MTSSHSQPTYFWTIIMSCVLISLVIVGIVSIVQHFLAGPQPVPNEIAALITSYMGW